MTSIHLPQFSRPSSRIGVPNPPPTRVSILRIYAPVGSEVSAGDDLCGYNARIPVYRRKGEQLNELDEDGNNKVAEEDRWDYYTEFGVIHSPSNGKILGWDVEEKENLVGEEQIQKRLGRLDSASDCIHPIKFKGMCGVCGADLNERSGSTDLLPSSSAQSKEFFMLSGAGSLNITVNYEEAARQARLDSQRLKNAKKLFLILDLDQTVIQAANEPTIGEWMEDQNNVNYPALRDVAAFYLLEPFHPQTGKRYLARYYVKPRPALQHFLESVAELYEIHVYTMGVRDYAEQVCKAIDPDGRFFSDRILTRSESFEGEGYKKTIQRLFPASDHSMIVIVDDRLDVWNYSPNIVPAIRYEFFPETGDINSVPTSPTKAVPSALMMDTAVPARSSAEAGINAPSSVPDAEQSSGTEEQSNAEIGGQRDVATQRRQQAISDQFHKRPLARMQARNNLRHLRKLYKKVSISSISSRPHSRSSLQHSEPQEGLNPPEEEDHSGQVTSSSAASSSKVTLDMLEADQDRIDDKQLTRDDIKTQIDALESELGEEVPAAEDFTPDYVESILSEKPEPALNSKDEELHRLLIILRDIHRLYYETNNESVPVQEIIASIPAFKPLSDCHLAFSGKWKEGQEHWLWNNAKWFGASCYSKYDSSVTHVITNLHGQVISEDVRLAFRKGKTIVNEKWLEECFRRQKHVPEAEYRVRRLDDSKGPSKDLNHEVPDNQTMDADPPPTFEVDWSAMSQEVDDAMNESEEDGDDDENIIWTPAPETHRKRSLLSRERDSESEGSASQQKQQLSTPLRKRRRIQEERGSSSRGGMISHGQEDSEPEGYDAQSGLEFSDSEFEDEFAAFEKELEAET
ncbi:hypothetical protein BT69DRAFT_1319045 [Atractiella rhizophila]|nr:hypothetical protein BT69DRAFT_1319045 [Atractiella rhizophila]